MVIRREQYDTGNFVRMLAREISCDTCAERFAQQINRAIGFEQGETFFSGGIETCFARLAGTVL